MALILGTRANYSAPTPVVKTMGYAFATFIRDDIMSVILTYESKPN